jgi:colanic acid/amylovoran biosynthesis glycosyltransferase
MMRVAYLINEYPKISHTFIRREIRALEEQGIEVVRFAIRGWAVSQVDEEDRIEQTRTHYVLRAGKLGLLLAVARTLGTKPLALARSLALAYRMGRRAERPLLVHLIYLAEACYIERQLRQCGVRRLHAHFGTNPAEVAMLVHLLGGPEWSFTVHGPEEFDKAAFIGLGEKLRRCSFVVAVSSYGRSQLYRWVEHQLWPKVQVVRCGLDRPYLAAAVLTAPQPRRLVCLGRLCEQKGQLLLLEAAHRLAADGMEFELVLAGDGELRLEIEALIALYKLQNKVTITGWISGDRARQEILAARALVLPSLAEGLPVVLMEAMALQRPVITTYIAGIPELVVPGEHGWLVPAGDLDGLTDAMRACLEAPTDLLARMGRSARQCVLERHDAEAEAAKLAALFSESQRKN